jgi:hypothetical protein
LRRYAHHTGPIDPDHLIAVKVWWAFAWRSFVIALALDIGVGVVIGLLGALFGVTDEHLESFKDLVAPVLALVIYVSVSIEVMRRILMKKFEDFKLVVLPRQD